MTELLVFFLGFLIGWAARSNPYLTRKRGYRVPPKARGP
jgi:hypothetical protein